MHALITHTVSQSDGFKTRGILFRAEEVLVESVRKAREMAPVHEQWLGF